MNFKDAIKIRLLVLLCTQSLIECPPILCPLANHFARYSPDGEIVDCIRCPNCPSGKGLSYPCGSKVSIDSKIECVFCEPNKTYSDKHDKGHCKSCQECGLRSVTQECTIYQNRECGGICPKGYVFDDDIDDCQKVKLETPTTSSTHSTKTVRLNPSHRETTEAQSRVEAYDVTTTTSPHSAKIKINSNQLRFPSTYVNNTPTQVMLGKVNDVLPAKEVQSQQDHKNLLVALLALIAVVIVVIILGVLTWIVCKKKQDHTPKRHEESTESAEENIPLTDIDASEGSSEATVSSSTTQEDLRDLAPQDKTEEQLLEQAWVDISKGNNILENEVSSNFSDAQAEDEANLENIPADILVFDMEHLCDKNGNLFNYVQKELDAVETRTRKTWLSVGRELKVHRGDLNLIEADRGRSPTECLLEILKTSGKKPTMREFVQALKYCGRRDIARYICDWPWREVVLEQWHQNQ